ncbi:glycosyltransferase [Mesobacillus selenatarsenatis]|uniref:Glycosyltransferase n=1 Tax=Mesobacillus selenatarsenatis (strain DSM 18680 / JCM 14380 / FERM P-15431 / SF-1) TaxID=1321606 RepID=A0A0A8WWM1_MESS1|nr:glycosyltransferase [Mesobacillus selenatarsenatis]GAM12008.1 glycosyltransferase [Mesobacillus selenatarsenatis SF-1]
MKDPNNIIIYRDSLLPRSETFVINQALSLQSFNPYFLGYKKVQGGIDLPEEKTCLYSQKISSRNNPDEILWKKLGTNPKFNRFIRDVNPDLIHAHFGPDGLIAQPYAKRHNKPLLVTFHGYDVTVKDEYLLKQSYNIRQYAKNQHMLKNDPNASFVAVSSFIRKKLIDKGFPEERIFTHYIGVDLQKLQISQSVKRENAVLFVGRLIENKGCEFLLEAFKKISAHSPETELWIVGDGPEKKQLEEKARAISTKITFFGVKPYEEVIRLMNRAKIFSVPSVEIDTGASEGLGMVFVEAHAMGLPVVSFKTGGIPEAVINNETGLLVNQRDVKGLADSLLTLLQNPALIEKMSLNALDHARKNFDIERQTHKLEDIYRSVIKQDTTKN